MYTTYENFKSLVSSKSLLIQYGEFSDHYDLFAQELGILYNTTIYKANAAVDGINVTTEATRVSDFETHYKSTANAPLEIKAGAGRPMRISASPQPANTVEHWKGFQITVAAGQTSAYADIAFSSLVYLKGGYIVSADVDLDDFINVDVLVVANNATYIPGIINNAWMIPNQPVSFESAESMAFPTSLKIRVTLNIGTAGATDVHANILMDYFI